MVDFGKLQLQMSACDFTTLQTSEIKSLDVSQWKQLPMDHTNTQLENVILWSLYEEEILQTNIHDLKTMAIIFLDPYTKLVYPLH